MRLRARFRSGRRFQPSVWLLLLGLFLPICIPINSAFAAKSPATQFQLGDGYAVRTAVFSRDLQWLAISRAHGGRLEVWDTAKGSKLLDLTTAGEGGLGASPTSAFLPGLPRLLLTTGTNVVVYDLVSGKVEKTLEESAVRLRQLGASPDGRLVVGVLQGPVPEFAFWSLPSGQRLKSLPTKRAPWETATSAYQPRLRLNDKPPASMPPGTDWAVSSDGQLFAIGFPLGVDFWDLTSGRWLSRFSGWQVGGIRSAASQARPALTSVGFLSNTDLVAVFNQTAIAILDSQADPSPRPTLLTGINTVPKTSLEIRALSISPTAHRFALGGMRMGERPAVFAGAGEVVFDVPMYGEVQVWDAAQLKPISTIRGTPDQNFGCVALDANGKHIAAVTVGVTTKMTSTGQNVKAPLTGYEMNPTGPFDVVVWELQ